MKWLVGLFLVWITLRGRYGTYSAFASGDAPKEGNSPLSQLKGLMDIFGN